MRLTQSGRIRKKWGLVIIFTLGGVVRATLCVAPVTNPHLLARQFTAL
jgi:hypothetical protein